MSGPLDQSLFCAGGVCWVLLSTLPRAAYSEGLEQLHLLAPFRSPLAVWNVLQNGTFYTLTLQAVQLVVQKTQPCILWSSNAHPCLRPVGYQVIQAFHGGPHLFFLQLSQCHKMHVLPRWKCLCSSTIPAASVWS